MLNAHFYKTEQGDEPVRAWIKGFSSEIQKHIGKELQKVQFDWPVGPPRCKKVQKDLYEFRTSFEGQEYRILLTFFGKDSIVLLHGLIKKANKIPQQDIDLAKKRLSHLEKNY